MANKNKNGFSLVEVLVVTVVVAVLAMFIIPFYGNWQMDKQVDSVSRGLVAALRTAASQSVVSLDNSAYGVYLDLATGTQKYVLYQGDSYLLRDRARDQITSLDDTTAITDTPAQDYNFHRNSGEPNTAGVITVSNTNNADKRYITIGRFGIIK